MQNQKIALPLCHVSEKRRILSHFFCIERRYIMLIVEITSDEQLDKALRRFKKKFEKVGILKETRRRAAYNKPSVVKKEKMKKAVGRQRYYARENF